MDNEELHEQADLLIETNDEWIHIIAAEHGQDIDDVKNLPWFRNALVERLAEEAEPPEEPGSILDIKI